MRRSRSGRDAEGDSNDEFGADPGGSRPSVASLFTALVPPAVARRSVAASVTTDRDVYERDEPVEITVTFKNRLPFPVELPTPRQRRWGWTIDGHLEASDERLYTREQPATFDFRGGERKRLSVTWNGRFERVRGDDRRESVIPDPGEYEVQAFVATDEVGSRPSDSTTIRLE